MQFSGKSSAFVFAVLCLHGGASRAQVEDRGPTCVALAVYSEARGESWEGQAAVVQVVLNRQRDLQQHSLPGADACDAVLEAGQFEGVENWKLPRVPRDKAAWKQALAVTYAMIFHDYYLPPPLQTAIYFRAHTPNPALTWNGVPLLGTVGGHDFYGPKSAGP